MSSSVDDHAVGNHHVGVDGIHVDSISVDSTQLCSEFKVYSSVGMTLFFFTALDGSSAVGLCLFAYNVYSLMISFLHMTVV